MKTPGLSRFQFSLNIQHPGPAIPVDVNKLVCIDKYVPSEDTTLKRNKSKRKNKSRVDVNLDWTVGFMKRKMMYKETFNNSH